MVKRVKINRNSATSRDSRGYPQGFSRASLLLIITLVIVIGGIFAFVVSRQKADETSSVRSLDNYQIQAVSLDDLASTGSLILDTSQSLSINGQLRVNNSLVLGPSAQPGAGTVGQMYYDNDGNYLAYFDGTKFVGIANEESLAELRAQIQAVSSSIPQTTIIPQGIALQDGNNTFTGANLFTGGLTASALTSGSITTANLTASASAVLQGTLSVSGATNLGPTTISSLLLSTPLGVSSGGTGATSLTNNEILLGQGTNPISSVGASGPNLCLMSTAGAPAFQVCPGGVGSGVNSLNSLMGDISIANASSAGVVITVDDASTTAKGISQYNASNFSVASGIVNTIQDISTTSTPTFSSLNLSSPLAVSSGGTGANTLPANGVLIGQGTAAFTGVTSGSAGQCLISTVAAPVFQNCPGGGGVLSFNGQTGALSLNNSTNSGSTIIIDDASTTAKGIAQFNASNFSASGGVVNTIQNIGTTSSPIFNALTLNVPLSVSSGGTGTNTFTSNGLLLGQGGSALTTVTAGSAGLCLTSTAGAPVFQACPGSGGVTSVNGLTGILNLNNASGSGATITIDDATITTKGIASFDASNFTVTSGAVNTIQNIGTGATPTFAGLNLSTALSVANGGTGANTLSLNGVLIGQGSGAVSSVTAGGVGECLISTAGAPTFQACPGSGGVSSINGLNGAVVLNNSSGAGANITIDDATTTTKGIASFNGTNFTVTSGAVNTVQNINTTAAPTFGGLTVNGAINGQTISNAANFTGSVTIGTTLFANTITPSGAMTIGATGQSLALQGNASTSLSATAGGSTSTLAFQSPTANVTYRLQTAAAGTYDVCTTVGNCTGVGGGVTSPGGTTGTIAKFSGSNTLVDSLLSESGSVVTVAGTLSVNDIASTGTLTVGGTAQTLILQGDGSTRVSATSGGITNSLLFATPAGSNKSITLPNASGTVAVSASGPISIDANGNISCPTCTTSGGGGGGAVDMLNGLNGTLTIANATGVGSVITIDDATTTTKGIASFNSTNFSVTAGAVNTIQDISVSSTPTFNSLNLSTALSFTSSATTNFTTPLGASTPTKINIPLTNPGAFGQLLAFGLPSTADQTARVISIFDARTGAHQPSVAVFSPDENQIFGFSWDGSNTLPVVKSSTNSIGLQAGNSTLLTANFIGGNIAEAYLGSALGTTGRLTMTNTSNVNTVSLQSGVTAISYVSNLMTGLGTAGQCLSVSSVAGVNQQLGYQNCVDATNVIQNQNASQQAASNFWLSGTGRADTALQAPTFDTATAAVMTLGGNATSISVVDDTVLAANKSLTVTGGATGTRPTSPTEGMVYFDTTTKQLLTYANGKWQADRTTATKIVGMGNATGCTGTSPVASQGYDGADYVVTSCTSAQTTINAAITALPAGGGTVYLMEGTYVIDGSILPNTKTRLIGAGPGTVIMLKDGINATLEAISTTGKHEVEISHLALHGNKANNSSGTQNGIDTNGSGTATQTGTVMNNLTISNFRTTGIDMVNGKSGRITNSSIFSNALGIMSNGQTEMTISNNTISSNTGNGIEVHGSENTISNNTMRANAKGIYSQSGNHNIFSGNVITASTSTGIDLYSAGEYNTVSGNTVSGGAGVGISINLLTSQTLVTGNVVEGNALAGISVSTASNDNSISNNKLHNNGGSGSSSSIEVRWDSDFNRVTGNMITDTAGTGYAIRLDSFGGTPDQTYISGNTFSGVGATAISDSGVGTIYANQSMTAGGLDTAFKQTNSASAFTIQNATGVAQLTADTTNSRIQIGSSTTDATAIVFALDNYNQATDPTGVNGAMYYNTSLNKFRCYQGGAWMDCVVSAGSGANTSLSNLVSTNINTALNATAADLTLQTTTSGNVIINAAGTTELQDDTNVGGNLTVAATKSLTLVGGNTASRPASPTEGMVYYDTDTKQLLTYANGKWQGDRTTATKIVAASNSPQAVKDSADYVATGTGDQAQINSAITAVNAAGGGTVYVAEGTYTVNDSINMLSKVAVKGAGEATLITIPNSHNASLNVFSETTNPTDVEIRDLSIDLNGTNQTSSTYWGVAFSTVGSGSGASALKGGLIENVTVKNIYRGGAIFLNATRHVTVNGIVAINGQDGTRGVYVTGSSQDIIIKGSSISGLGETGISANSSSQVVISNNTIDAIGAGAGSDSGIEVNGSTNVSVTSNIVTNGTANGIHISGSSSQITVNNNTIVGGGRGLSITQISNSTLSGNNISGTSNNGMYVVWVTYLTIADNSIKNAGADGIYIPNLPSTDNTITGNTISGSTGWGIYLWTGAGRNTIANNTLTTNSNGAVGLGSAYDTTVTGNRIYNNGGTGSSSSIVVSSSTGTVITNNHISDTAGTGYAINLNAGSTGAYISGNTFSGTGATIINNLATDTVYANQSMTATGLDTLFKQTNSASAFVVQNATGVAQLTADTTNSRIQIGSSTTDATVIVFALDNYNQATDPTGVNGAMYYNTNLNKFRCFENGVWGDCITAAGSGANTSLSNLASTNINTALNATGADLTLQTTTSGNIILNAVGTTELQDDTNVGGNLTIAATKSLTLTGGNTASRPASPTEGMIYFDTTTKQLLVYANGKWQADRTTATKIVGTSAVGGASSAVASQNPDSADFVNTSDTSAQTVINAAISALPAGGGTVYLMEGTYIVDGNITLASNVKLVGAGNSTIIKIKNSTNAAVSALSVGTATRVTIQDLLLEGNKANNSSGVQYGISTGSNADYLKIDSITAQNFRSTGVSVGSGTAAADISNSVMSGNTTSGLSFQTVYNSSVKDNSFISNGTYGMSIDGYYNSVSGNIVRSNTGTGIFGYSFNTPFTNNMVSSNGSVGMLISGPGSTIVGNAVRLNTSIGIYINGSDIVASSNTVTDNGNAAIYMGSVSNVQVDANRLSNNGGSGAVSSIAFIPGTTASNNRITNNLISDTAGTAYAIAISNADAVNTYLSGNTFSGTGATSINDLGTSTRYSNQTLTATGLDTLFKQTNSASAFVVQNATGVAQLTADTTNSRIQIGSSTTDATVIVFALDNYNQATDPTGVNGAMYYNTNLNKFRCFENGVWGDCITAAGSGANTSLSNLASTNINTALNATGADLTLQTTTSGNIILNAVGTTELQDDTNVGGNLTIAATKSLTLTGGNTASRPASPTEGMIYYDTTTKQLLVYANGKWQADRTTGTKTVAMGTATGCTGSSPVTSQNYDSADYVVTSCTSAQTTINAAITALPAGGGTVYLMEGTYIIDGAILPNTKTRLVGAGPGTVLKLKDAINAGVNMITASSVHEVSIEQLYLDGNKANNSSGNQEGIHIGSSGSATQAGTTMNNLTVSNFRDKGISIVLGKSDKLTNSSLFSNATGISFNAVTEVTISNNTISSNTGNGIEVFGTYSSISNNTLRANSTAIYVQGGNHNTISNNVISASTGSYSLDLWGAGDANTVTGNTVIGGAGVGIALRNNSHHTIVTDNMVEANAGEGIYVQANDSLISNNKLHNNGGSSSSSSIYIGGLGGSDRNTVSDNLITDTAGTGFAISLQNFGATSDNNYLSNNTYSGTGAASISDGAVGTVYAGQIDGSTNYRIQPAGTIELLKNTNVTGTLTVSGATTLNGSLAANSTALFKNATDSTTAFQIQSADATVLFAADTTNKKIVISTLEVTQNITLAGHLITGGTAPNIAAGVAACTSPTVSVTGTDTAGTITVTTGTACVTGKLATVTFATAFGASPRITLTSAGANAAGLATYVDDATISTTTFDVTTTATPVASTTYKWYYHVIQ